MSLDTFLKYLDLFYETKPRRRMGFSTQNDDDWLTEWRIERRMRVPIPPLKVSEEEDLFIFLKSYDKIINGGRLKKPLTEIDSETVEAIRLLREQFNTPDISDRPKFRGARVEGMKATEFFNEHYRGLKGKLSSSVLIAHDAALYDGLKSQLRSSSREAETLADYVIPKSHEVEQRQNALAELLGAEASPDGRRAMLKFLMSVDTARGGRSS